MHFIDKAGGKDYCDNKPHACFSIVKDGKWFAVSQLAWADGLLTARFGVASLDWATGWVLSYGAQAKSLEPPELVTRVREAAEGALSRYPETTLRSA